MTTTVKTRAPSTKKTRRPTTATRIAELEASVARHERELDELRQIVQKTEVSAVFIANGVRNIVERMVDPDFAPLKIPPRELVPELFPDPPTKVTRSRKR